jgi:dihydroxyacetone kinase-like predicted kinase
MPALPLPTAGGDGAPGEYGYETVFILRATEAPLDLVKIRADLERIGESVLVAGDASVCKVHVHNLQPDQILA